MLSNLHKSEEGWRRFRERTGNGHMCRRAMMDHRPRKKAGPVTRAILSVAELVEDGNESRQPRLRGRRRVAIFG